MTDGDVEMKRYDQDTAYGCSIMEEYAHGDWVRYEDCKELLQQADDMLRACVWNDAGQCSYCDAFASNPHLAGCVAAKLLSKISEVLK